MASCEKCWGDAYFRHITTGKDQADCYREILSERKDNHCTPREQAGQFWNEKELCDNRYQRRTNG